MGVFNMHSSGIVIVFCTLFMLNSSKKFLIEKEMQQNASKERDYQNGMPIRVTTPAITPSMTTKEPLWPLVDITKKLFRLKYLRKSGLRKTILKDVKALAKMLGKK